MTAEGHDRVRIDSGLNEAAHPTSPEIVDDSA
jgi:hypothetical protein